VKVGRPKPKDHGFSVLERLGTELLLLDVVGYWIM
jgi:hypothetical protein